VISYNPATGEELWRTQCLSGDVAPSACFAGGLVIVAQEGAGAYAIRPTKSGDEPAGKIVWKTDDWLPDTVSPASNGELVWLVGGGMVVCLDLKTGRKVWEHDLGMPCCPRRWSSAKASSRTPGVMHILTPAASTAASAPVCREAVQATPALVEGACTRAAPGICTP
jgi:outer membrane protein assembly factor BamB